MLPPGEGGADLLSSVTSRGVSDAPKMVIKYEQKSGLLVVIESNFSPQGESGSQKFSLIYDTYGDHLCCLLP